MTGQLSHLHHCLRNSLRTRGHKWRVGSRGTTTTTVTEERGTYNVPDEGPDRAAVGVEHIGDVLRRLIDERGWPPLGRIPQANGNRPGTNDGRWHADA